MVHYGHESVLFYTVEYDVSYISAGLANSVQPKLRPCGGGQEGEEGQQKTRVWGPSAAGY